MPWASMLYNLEFLPTGAPVPPGNGKHWHRTGVEHCALVDGVPLPSKMERAESSESESSSGSDSDGDYASSDAPPPLTPRKRRMQPATSPRDSQADLNGSPVQCVLPQRPGNAMTRNTREPWGHRHSPTIRSPSRAQNTCTKLPAHLTPINNHGLFLPGQANTKQSGAKPRSEDRIRAAQHLFRALGHTNRSEQARTEPGNADRAATRPRISFLHGLSAQADRRNSKHDLAEVPKPAEPIMPQFSRTMQGTQQCVIATESSTFELVITPPSPRPDGEDKKKGITGVRITSHRSRAPPAISPPSPTLQPPPFELAPGRSRHLAQQRRQAAPQLLAQQAVHRNLAPSPSPRALMQCNTMPLQESAVQARRPTTPMAHTTPSKEATPPRFCQGVHFAGIEAPSSKYVPPGRRRRMPGAVAHSPMGARVAMPLHH